MRRWFARLVVFPLMELALRAWGRRLLTTDQCRAITTAIARVGLIGHRAALAAGREVSGE